MATLDDQWKTYLSSQSTFGNKPTIVKTVKLRIKPATAPACEELYISTKTKVLYLNQHIDIHSIFWDLPVIEYWQPVEGIVKKQIKIVSKTEAEFFEYQQKLTTAGHYVEQIIKQINNPTARRIKFKDERKITVGISKKDIMNCRGKAKNAFYNCFALIFRFKYKGVFKEIHVKVFNTGKLEIPGILNDEILEIIKAMILTHVQPHIAAHPVKTLDVEASAIQETPVYKQLDEVPLTFVYSDKDDNVLINSNFNCGFYINRDRLYAILRETYGIESAFDPCSYPGVKCKFYFNNEIGFNTELQNGKITVEDRSMKMSELSDNKKYTEISVMTFRTGSVLIVGNCSERVLMFIFEFIKNLLRTEYNNIFVENEDVAVKDKTPKLRKKIITVTQAYYNELKK